MQVPPRIAIAAGGAAALGGGAYWWHRRQLAQLDEEASAELDGYAPDLGAATSSDPYAAAGYADSGYGSTYLSPSTSGVGGGGFGGTGEQQGSTLADILPLLAAINQLPPGQATGGGLPPGPTINPGPGQADVPVPGPAAVPPPVAPAAGNGCPPPFPRYNPRNGHPGRRSCFRDRKRYGRCVKHHQKVYTDHVYQDGHVVKDGTPMGRRC